MYTGMATIYEPNGGYGSCGSILQNTDFVVALSQSGWMGTSAPASGNCGRQIKATNIGSDDGVGGIGNSVVVTVQDTCPGCEATHLDLSTSAWNQLTDTALWGTVNIEWLVIPSFRRLLSPSV
jgi:expansin (peptidoglycan-binding protein)